MERDIEQLELNLKILNRLKQAHISSLRAADLKEISKMETRVKAPSEFGPTARVAFESS